jgi:hypothetical protein
MKTAITTATKDGATIISCLTPYTQEKQVAFDFRPTSMAHARAGEYNAIMYLMLKHTDHPLQLPVAIQNPSL